MIHNPRKCGAFHSACENIRDAHDDSGLVQLANATSLRDLDDIAEGYVRNGLCPCTCPPLFKHDCGQPGGCTFLGTFEGRDLYVCNASGSLTVIARRSDEGSDYESGWEAAGHRGHEGHTDHLAEARLRAEAMGYRQ